MTYFDTDFWIHYFVIQERKKHLLVRKILEKTNFEESVFVSLLNIQEAAFVLAKLGLENFEIEDKMSNLCEFNPINFTLDEFKRATKICQKVGFSNINDCLHTAIAEKYCTEFYTFNQEDFKRIKNYTSLKIHIL